MRLQRRIFTLLVTSLVLASAPALAVPPGTISIDGGVDQNPEDAEHPGYRCDAKTPVRMSIQGPALIHVELTTESGPRLAAKDVVLAYFPNDGADNKRASSAERLVPLLTFEPKKGSKREPLAFALRLDAGPARLQLRCSHRWPVIMRLWSVESVPKKLPQLALP